MIPLRIISALLLVSIIAIVAPQPAEPGWCSLGFWSDGPNQFKDALAAYQTAQQLRQWYYGTDPRTEAQQNAAGTTQNNPYQGMDPYSWYTNTGSQYGSQQIGAYPNYSPQQYGNGQNPAQPGNNYQHIQQVPNRRSTTMVSNSSRSQMQSQYQNTAASTNPSYGVAYTQAYDRKQPQANDLLTKYRTAHHRSPGGKLRNTAAQQAPISRLFGSEWWWLCGRKVANFQP